MVFAAMFVALGTDVAMHGIAFVGGHVPAIHHAFVVPVLFLILAATVAAARTENESDQDVQK